MPDQPTRDAQPVPAEPTPGQVAYEEHIATLRAALERSSLALGAFIDYYEQAGIGQCLEGHDDDAGSFDGDEKFNVRLGRAALQQAREALSGGADG